MQKSDIFEKWFKMSQRQGNNNAVHITNNTDSHFMERDLQTLVWRDCAVLTVSIASLRH